MPESHVLTDLQPTSQPPGPRLDCGAGWNRRAALAGIVSAAAVAGLLPQPVSAAETSSDVCALRPVLRAGEALEGLVQAAEAQPGLALDRKIWLRDLATAIAKRVPGQQLAEAGPLQLGHAVRGAIRADWAADRVVWVDGWVFARTEVALAVAAVELDRAC